MKKRTRGSLTVEATIVLPIFILVIAFVLNFLNIFYMQLTVQQGLNNTASVIGQYCYAVDLTLPGGIDKLAMQAQTTEKAKALGNSITELTTAATGALDVFNSGLSIETLGELLKQGKSFVTATTHFGEAVNGVTGEDVSNFLFSAGTEVGGGLLVGALMEDYLTEMKVNRSLIPDGLQYALLFDAQSSNDLVLTAVYQYRHPMLGMFVDHIDMKQSVVVHPWIGGETDGLR